MSELTQEQLLADFAKAETLKCESCSNVLFIQSFILKKVSALVSSTGKEQILPIPVFSCGSCGALPDSMKTGLLAGEPPNELETN